VVRQAKAAVNKTEAAMTLANQEYDRIMRIQKKDAGAVSQSMVDRVAAEKERAESTLGAAKEDLQIAESGARPEDIAAKQAEIRSLQADVEATKDRLSYTYLKAPFGGVIVETFVENFEDVRAKEPIVRLLDPSRIEMVVDIPENLISYAPQVEEVLVRFDPFPDVEISAKIKEIGTEASQTTRTYPVTLIMDPPQGVQILPGMAGKALTKERVGPEATEGGIEVPLSALLQSGEENRSYVWVIDEPSNTVTRRPVTIGQFTDFGVLVAEGLEPGEWVVTAGVHQLRDGQQVRRPQ
jgi:RND family efflux transporter MFP subunit